MSSDHDVKILLTEREAGWRDVCNKLRSMSVQSREIQKRVWDWSDEAEHRAKEANSILLELYYNKET